MLWGYPSQEVILLTKTFSGHNKENTLNCEMDFIWHLSWQYIPQNSSPQTDFVIKRSLGNTVGTGVVFIPF